MDSADSAWTGDALSAVTVARTRGSESLAPPPAVPAVTRISRLPMRCPRKQRSPPTRLPHPAGKPIHRTGSEELSTSAAFLAAPPSARTAMT
ncbi:hypothetical protein ACFQHO_20635 [Actinomadura yumaensis]|uniref:hypothetical protein n=1 Tax=Actinomadura yumaensis TaxID=111807 RepID=UPI0036107018